LLRLVRPVRDTFGVRLAAAAVKKLKRVGELVDAVWEKLEEEAS
jgi:acyl carrier protein